MLAFLCETLFDMDLYSTLNSLAPLLTGTEYTGDPSSEAIYDFPPSDEPVYILGLKYSSLHELSDIRNDIRSIIWVTYRRGFPSIGDSGMTSDSGWGCMLRTGQMVLAEAFSKLHLGREWRWKYTDSISIQKLIDNQADEKSQAEYEKYCKYRQILKLFADLKTAPYSIHQIALMGACEGKKVGEWFGPNTVAQVLKKLSVFDKFNDIYIHVALDNMVFIDDIKKFCKSKTRLETNRPSKKAQENTEPLNENDSFWRPLILYIPLRLGLTEINPIYFRALKTTFAFPQTLGILGGRPNHALYFVGCVGDELIHLDPHTTQTTVNLSEDLTEFISQQLDDSVDSNQEHACSMVLELDDISYHCERASRMPISQLDPSIALCFLCRTEEELDQWANLTLIKLIQEEQQPLFEVMKERPANWPLFEEDFDLNQNNGSATFASVPDKSKPTNSTNANNNPTGASDASFTSLEEDEDYEIID